jgi:DNA-binding CsgD family transcriptional regulator
VAFAATQEVTMDLYSPPTATEADRVELLDRKAFSAIARGNWPEASEAAAECLALAEATGQPVALARGEAAAGIVAAVHGNPALARDLLARCEHAATRHGTHGLLDLVQLGRGLEALSADRYDEAWAQLNQLVGAQPMSSIWVRMLALSYLAEAALHRGGDAAANTVLAAVDELAHQVSAPALLGATAYPRAIARRGEAIDTTFDQALDECPLERAFDRARINLARGVCLRRERRVSESRAPLLEALVAFERLGATAWADHARSELRATGARRVRRELGDIETLTAQELQIVRMAAKGLSNREIGQRLFLSHRTIGSHLYRAFPKLGVAARSQLRDVLAEPVEMRG